jgi:hypothetical protein
MKKNLSHTCHTLIFSREASKHHLEGGAVVAGNLKNWWNKASSSRFDLFFEPVSECSAIGKFLSQVFFLIDNINKKMKKLSGVTKGDRTENREGFKTCCHKLSQTVTIGYGILSQPSQYNYLMCNKLPLLQM